MGGDRFHTLRIPGVSGVEMKIYETTTTNFIENWKMTNYITLLSHPRDRCKLSSSGALARAFSRGSLP